MANRLRLEGLEELKAALRSLPADLTGEASNIVEGASNGAAVAIKSGYASHRRTGNLQDGVTVDHQRVGFSVRSIVKNTAKHAYIFENGTAARHRASGASTGLMWGHMPPANVFIPTVVRARRAMQEMLIGLVRRAGFTVSGNG